MKNFIPQPVLKFLKKKYSDVYTWFWKQTNKRWDKKIEKDIANNRLNDPASRAIKDFFSGNSKNCKRVHYAHNVNHSRYTGMEQEL